MELNKVYYYNNRPVLAVAKHENCDFYQVALSREIELENTDDIAEQFRGCDSCMVGHKSECKCNEKVWQAEEIIEELVKYIPKADDVLIWVQASELKEKPFEYAKHKELSDAIEKNRKILDGMILILAEQKATMNAFEKEKERVEKEISGKKYEVSQMKANWEGFRQSRDLASEELKTLREEIAKARKVIVTDSFSISEEHYNELLSRSNFLTKLEAAGVDNWEGYEIAQEDDENN
jgi:chromosome segregation ATPase